MKFKIAFYALVMIMLASGAAFATGYTNPCSTPDPPNVELCAPYGTGIANIYTFTPKDPDMNDLDHTYLYYWGIDVTNAINNLGFDPDDIIGAEITIKNIYDWTKEPNTLWVNLLDGRPTNFGSYTKDGTDVWVWNDNQYPTNKFASANTSNILIDKWTDLDGPATHNDLTFTFDATEVATLITYILNDNKLGIGLDPDCHYYNDGIKLKIYTECEVPEPGSLPLFLSSAFAGLAFIGMRKK
jgi:hypothetical protein